jgi:hypothetical protein
MMSRSFGLATALGVVMLAAPASIAVATDANQAQNNASMLVEVAAKANGKTEQRMKVYLTGYSYWDNTPPGSAAISKPVVHNRAGGTGTFNDPITIAVGHSIIGGVQTLDYPAGTRFYIERLRKYAIVEDVCGDGARPQNGPCHTGYKGHPWLDIYVGGATVTSKATTSCARRITALQNIIINPRPDYPVFKGEVVDSGCKLFG